MARTPTKTERGFQHKAPDPRVLTSERIADHLRAFQSTGGRIEVLGVTRVLKKLDETAVPRTKPAPTR
ncbi:hypothetical protein [Lysobacter solisilvae (ex Woo and Kim 2020)]|nr:hypothetical protein [Lysobacter terrestris]